MMDDQPIIKTSDKCPCCGSTERFAGGVAKEQGMENAETFGLWAFSGPVGDKKKLDMAPIGSKCTHITAVIDVCTGIRDDGSVCGCAYAIRQETVIVTKVPLPPQMGMPPMGPSQKPPGFDPYKLPFGKGKG